MGDLNEVTPKSEDGVSNRKFRCLKLRAIKQWYKQRLTHALGVGILFWLLLLTLLCHYSIKFLSTDCCKEIELKSNSPSTTNIKTIGSYSSANNLTTNNHRVYRHNRNSSFIQHIVFNSKHGWRVYPKKPTNPDDYPGTVRFVGCTIDCPESCKNDGLWTYYDKVLTEFKTDREKSLSLNCGPDEAQVTISSVVTIAILFIVATSAVISCIFCVACARRSKRKIGKSVTNEDTFYDTSLLPVEPGTQKIVVRIECPKNIYLPENTINFKAICNSEPPIGHVYKYVWELKPSSKLEGNQTKSEDPIMAIVKSREDCEWSRSNIKEGSYYYKVTVSSSYPSPNGLKGEANGTLHVFPETSVTGIPNKIIKSTESKVGANVWSNTTQGKIKVLPVFLEGSTLFQLPYEAIPKGVTLSVVTAKPSNIYIAQALDKGWNLSTIKGSGFKLLSGRSVITDSVGLHAVFQKTSVAGERIPFPIIDQTDSPQIAIFIVQFNK